MMEELTFIPYEDIINSIHLLRTLGPDEPPECTDLLDYFDRTYISGTLRQQQKATNYDQHERLVIQRTHQCFQHLDGPCMKPLLMVIVGPAMYVKAGIASS